MDREEEKKAIYDRLSPRRRKFVDRIGYERWDPFQEPKHPIEIRKEMTNRTLEGLFNEFFQQVQHQKVSRAYVQGVKEACVGVFQADDRYHGIFEFCLWYFQELEKNGIKPEELWNR